ncbi:MAG: hypothetical protein H8M99_00185 [Gloeobacteraceae cyanobacterium ES-bin-144]|nr:hypothetical protein [Verrucomicrobiales bacterium]
MSGNDEIGLPTVVLFGFVSICAHPRIFQNPLTTDAQIVVLALQEKAFIHSNDTDFLRFPDIRWRNPLMGKDQCT